MGLFYYFLNYAMMRGKEGTLAPVRLYKYSSLLTPVAVAPRQWGAYTRCTYNLEMFC